MSTVTPEAIAAQLRDARFLRSIAKLIALDCPPKPGELLARIGEGITADEPTDAAEYVLSVAYAVERGSVLLQEFLDQDSSKGTSQ